MGTVRASHEAPNLRAVLKTCATCRFMAAPRSEAIDWWDEETDESGETEHATCTRIIHGNRGFNHQLKSIKELAVVTDGSGYAASLRVLPTFGCVLHEEKEAPSLAFNG